MEIEGERGSERGSGSENGENGIGGVDSKNMNRHYDINNKKGNNGTIKNILNNNEIIFVNEDDVKNEIDRERKKEIEREKEINNFNMKETEGERDKDKDKDKDRLFDSDKKRRRDANCKYNISHYFYI